jgi:hypothetical protein
MKTLKNHIVEDANTARGARKKRRRGREPAADDEPVRVIRSLGLDGATVSLPAGIDLERRAERMNAFWERSFASSIKTWSSSQCARMAGASGANCLSAVSEAMCALP